MLRCELAAGRATLLGLWGDGGVVHRAHGGDRLRMRTTSPSSASNVRDGTFPSVGALHPPAHPARTRHSRVSTGLSRSARRTRGPGSISAFGTCSIRLGSARRRRTACSPTRFCRRKAKACIRFPSARCMPASSSRAISASPPAAKPWSARTAARLCAQGHRGADGRRDASNGRRKLAARTSGDSTVAYAHRLRPRRRSGAGRRSAAARAIICAR